MSYTLLLNERKMYILFITVTGKCMLLFCHKSSAQKEFYYCRECKDLPGQDKCLLCISRWRLKIKDSF